MIEAARGVILPMKVSLEKQFSAMCFVNKLLRLKFKVLWANKQFLAKTPMFPGGYQYSAGDFVVPLSQATPFSSKKAEAFIRTLIEETSKDLGTIVHGIKEKIEIEAYELSAPRITVYKGPGTWEGYLWYQQCLEKLGFMTECITPSEIKDGKLKNFDVFVMPGGDETWQSAALWPEGRREIIRFLRNGGNYLASCGGLDVAGHANGTSLGSPYSGKIKYLNIVEYNPTRDIPRSEFPHDEWAKLHYFHLDFNEYSQLVPVKWESRVPVRVKKHDSPIVFGYPDVILPGLCYSAGPLPKELRKNVISIAEFAPDLLPLDSPWSTPPDYAFKLLEGATAIAVAKYGRGKLVLFSPHPENPRCKKHFRLVANAVFFLTGIGPSKRGISSRKVKPRFVSASKSSKEKLMAHETANQSLHVISEVKHEFSAFESTWSEIRKKLEGWTYEHVPEMILKLPGYSQIWMPELEIEVPKCKLDELPHLILKLNLNYQKLCEIEEKLSERSGKESNVIREFVMNSKNKIHDTLNKILMETPLLRDSIIEAKQQLEDLRPKTDEILRTRAEIKKLKQPPTIEEKLTTLWQNLDLQQSEFDSIIWGEILLKIDGKAEVSMYSEWKEGIIEKRAEGVAPKLINFTFLARRTFEDSSYAIIAADFFKKNK